MTNKTKATKRLKNREPPAGEVPGDGGTALRRDACTGPSGRQSRKAVPLPELTDRMGTQPRLRSHKPLLHANLPRDRPFGGALQLRVQGAVSGKKHLNEAAISEVNLRQ